MEREVPLTKLFLLSAVVLAAALPSFGNSFYAGSDTACFYGILGSSCTPVSTETGVGVNLAGDTVLDYTPDSSFSAPETGGTVELGNFYVVPSLLGANLDGTFVVDVTFTDPADGGQTFTAKTEAFVILTVGGAEVTFSSPTTQEFDYAGGSFDVSLPSTPILIDAGDTVALDATITTLTTPTPEPASIATLLGGLMLAGVVVLRSRAERTRRRLAAEVLS
jgi:hypothetical protein